MLFENSHLTRTQLETLLIDVLSEHFAGKQLKYDEKASFRLIKSKISRGAFNRTLMQAKQNVINSVYTVMLLGYLGVFETVALSPYLAIADKLHSYAERLKHISEHEKTDLNSLKIAQLIRDELENSLKQLSSPSEM